MTLQQTVKTKTMRIRQRNMINMKRFNPLLMKLRCKFVSKSTIIVSACSAQVPPTVDANASPWSKDHEN